MTVEKFLSFWDQHNTAIIEGLVALIVLISLFLAYRAFFAKKDQGGGELGSGSLDAAQLEKTLQKILENQQASGKSPRSAAASEDFGVDVEMDESPAPVRGPKVAAAAESAVDAPEVKAAIEGVKESAAEVAQLRLSLTEGHQKIAELQAQLQEAQAAAQAGGGGGASEGGMSSAEKEELNGKLRDLEARLAEYEIISEDIADLSRYRDENEELKKQLEALKAGGAAAPAATPAAAEPAPTPAPTPAVEEPVAEVAVEAAPAEGGSDLIDDDLMKEFAAAVEGQRALDKAAEKAGDGSDEAAKAGDETNQLMSEFENFVSKKS